MKRREEKIDINRSYRQPKLASFWKFFSGGGQNLLLCKFLLLCYCFRTKFQRGLKFSKVFPAPWKKASKFGNSTTNEFVETNFQDPAKVRFSVLLG